MELSKAVADFPKPLQDLDFHVTDVEDKIDVVADALEDKYHMDNNVRDLKCWN